MTVEELLARRAVQAVEYALRKDPLAVRFLIELRSTRSPAEQIKRCAARMKRGK